MTKDRLVALRERLQYYRDDLSTGRVSEEVWSGLVECGVEATALRQDSMDALDNDPDCERSRLSAQYAMHIETDIWAFAEAIAELCFKESGAQGKGDI